MSADKRIADILAKYDEPVQGNVWRVQQALVIYHACLERIAARAKIAFDPPQWLRTERDEAVVVVTGRMGDKVMWDVGEAVINVNYRISGRQAAYVYAMATKRAKDRVILKLIELHGLVYSEEEADEFKQDRATAQEEPATPPHADRLKPKQDDLKIIELDLINGVKACRDQKALDAFQWDENNIDQYERLTEAGKNSVSAAIERQRASFGKRAA
jgi:hypothetical protein